MTGTDKDDVVAIVFHLTRIIARGRCDPHDQYHRGEMASEIAAYLCTTLGLDSLEVGREASAQSAGAVQ